MATADATMEASAELFEDVWQRRRNQRVSPRYFNRTEGRYGVLVIDVGAFTTDFGYVLFNDSFWDENIAPSDVVQRSREVGVRKLDQDIIVQFSDEARRAISRTRQSSWEDAKRRLFHGESFAIEKPSGGRIIIERKSVQAQAINDAIDTFANEIVEAKNDFSKNLEGEINALVLTGGGIKIPRVREILIRAMPEDRKFSTYDLLDDDEPLRAREKAVWPDDTEYNERTIEERRRQNRDLVRGGSAIGGCSVFFE